MQEGAEQIAEPAQQDPRTVPPEDKIYVVLEAAPLEVAKVKDGFHLLNCDDHKGLLKKNNKNIGDYRPDICHQCLLTLLDSPLNKSGHLQVYIHTSKNVLIEVNSQIRIPRTYKRFAGLMVQLLHTMKIRSEDGQYLMRTIQNPIESHLPAGCRKFAMSYKAPRQVDIFDFATSLPRHAPVCFVIGAFAHGMVNPEFTEETLSISGFPLSGSVVCGRVCNAFERIFQVI
ncbi:putative Ribosomal RNA small subunit methyltransferase NEP1 [Paratrimastix pyriformis]|uniref:Ribosomal RNA small subunit methyltransferase NEP1 n=1 Tax=Paratrimastix pyriformis TaxID=342808 RepID=A0ABQ8UUT8_9EUKA|nr:putative Ribosomal RNA small subunit methyltransferase NEP1 [Paratrimastix pyriformis]|eukprot:GAFH01004753.1.p1 GENE.GAFH01004753.1~~GAFH01004753.1.p1  ORF type:complete len:242 (-),score=23.32 GAFH01004753.1:17-703(-)